MKLYIRLILNLNVPPICLSAHRFSHFGRRFSDSLAVREYCSVLGNTFYFIRYSLGPLPENIPNSFFSLFVAFRFAFIHSLICTVDVSMYLIHFIFSNFTGFALLRKWKFIQPKMQKLKNGFFEMKIWDGKITTARFSVEFGILKCFHSVLEP